MKIGDKIKCRRTDGYRFTEGAVYEVIGYTPQEQVAGGFTFPAYVTVEDDTGREVTAHAHRFEPTNEG